MSHDDKTLEELLAELAIKHREIAHLFGEMADRVALHNQRVAQLLTSAQAMSGEEQQREIWRLLDEQGDA